jgi:hypothetical protein
MTVDTISAHSERVNTETPKSQKLKLVYWICLTACVISWVIPIRSPLWLDENVSYWQIHRGPSEFWSRAYASVPTYSYILWFFSKLLGTGEVALRIPSVLAMLGAAYLLYRMARELFGSNVAWITVTLFCLNPIVAFAAIDARPYAFAALAINASIYVLVRLRASDSIWLATCLGILGAIILWFHFLFAVMVPGLLAGFMVVKFERLTELSPPEVRQARVNLMWRQLAAATGGFVLTFLPTIPGLLFMFRTKSDHPFDTAPDVGDLIFTLAPNWSLLLLAATAFVALIIAGLTPNKPKEAEDKVELWQAILCLILALVPLLLLFGVSVATPLHIFLMRYRLIAVPGISLCWGLLLSWFRPRVLQVLFCIAMAILAMLESIGGSRQHGYTWKYAIEVAEKSTASDHAPVLMCSDLPEADHWPMPTGEAVKDSTLFAPLSYYKLNAPVVALPRSRNDEAMKIGSSFIQEAGARHERFLAIAYRPSYPTLQWLMNNAAASHNAQKIGEYDGVAVVEFVPRTK